MLINPFPRAPSSITEETINSLLRFFLCLIVFWLPYSPAVVESSVIICFLLWIFKRIAFRHGAFLASLRPVVTPLDRPILFFLVACFLSAANSAFPLQSLSNFLTKTLEWFIVYFFVAEAVTTKKHVWLILTVFSLTLLATVIDSFIQYYFTYKDIFFGHVIQPGTRATASFKTPNGLGAYLSLALPLIFASIFFSKRRIEYRLLVGAFFFLTVWSLITTFSRGGSLATISGIMFCVLFLLFKNRKQKFHFLSSVLTIVILLGIYLGFIVACDGGGESLRYNTICWRLNLWGDVVRMILDRPFFGHGINTFMSIFQIYRRDIGANPTYAHNSYLQMTFETGLLGIAVFIWLLVVMCRTVVGTIMSDGKSQDQQIIVSIGLFSGIIAFLVHSFFDNNFYSLQLSVYLWFMIGLLMVLINMIKGHKWLNPSAH